MANNKHHLNNLIGELEWIDLHKSAIETDKELAMLNASPGEHINESTFQMGDDELQEQYRIL